MNIYKCEKCGLEEEGVIDWVPADWNETRGTKRNGLRIHFYLCPKCAGELQEWIKDEKNPH